MTEHEKATPRPWYHEALDEIEDYFDQRADADRNGVRYIANKEMLHLQAVRAVKQQMTHYDASRALIEQMRDALRVASAAAFKVDGEDRGPIGEQVKLAIAAAEKFLEGR